MGDGHGRAPRENCRRRTSLSAARSPLAPLSAAAPAFLLFAFFLLTCASAALTFPALSGRVVDQAGIIPAAAQLDIEPKLRALEDKSGIQLVVATVQSIGGTDIETYANQLFRAWKLGEAENNNGVLLLVAPNERKVRIEVGYGLEGTLTDALSKVIIANAITPRFKTGDFGGGVTRGVDDIITVLTTDASEWAKRPSLRAEDQGDLITKIMPFLILGLFLFIVLSMIRSARTQRTGWLRRGGQTIFIPSSGGGSSWSGGGSSWGGGGGASWGGGGGSSGGGGASGGW